MFRNLLILLIFIGVGFGANVAQSDIFVRQSPKADASKKKNIFLSPFKGPNNQAEQIKKRFSAPVISSNVTRRLTNDLKLLAYWKQAQRLPETVDELQSYAQALRAPDLKRVLDGRGKLLASLEAIAQGNLDDFRQKIMAQAPNMGMFKKVNDLIAKGLGIEDLLKDPEAFLKETAQEYVDKGVEKVKAEAEKKVAEALAVVEDLQKLADQATKVAQELQDVVDDPLEMAGKVEKEAAKAAQKVADQALKDVADAKVVAEKVMASASDEVAKAQKTAAKAAKAAENVQKTAKATVKPAKPIYVKRPSNTSAFKGGGDSESKATRRVYKNYR